MERLQLRTRDVDTVRQIREALSLVRLDDDSGVRALLPAIRELLRIDTVGVYSLRNRTGAWQIDRWDAYGRMVDGRVLLQRTFDRVDDVPLFYNPLAPPPSQRNRVVDAMSWVDRKRPGEWERSRLCVEVMSPLGFARAHQPRVLMCDGPTLVGWFGGICHEAPTRRQLRLLGLLAEPMRRRLSAEHRLRAPGYVTAVLDVALEHLGAPALIVSSRGDVYHANAGGQEAFVRERAQLLASFQDVLRHRVPSVPMEVIPIRESAGTHCWLVILEAGTVSRIRTAVHLCRTRWELTSRQTTVLEHLMQGLPNSAIASLLGCVERSVEHHVSALLDKAGVDNRAALVARALMSI